MLTSIITYARVANANGRPVFLSAGNRLRLIPAYDAVIAADGKPVIYAGANEKDILSSDQFQNSEQVLFGKLISPMSALVAACRRDGKRVIVDICDDPWDYPELRPMIDVASVADFCTTSSEGLARKLRDRLKVRVEVVKEPPDCAYATPRVAPDPDCLRLLWFGSDTNADSLCGSLSALIALSKERRVELTLLGGYRTAYEKILRSNASDLGIRFLEWQPGLLDQLLEESDIVLLPKRNGPWSELKSENRLVTSIAAGRIAVAGRIPSYERLCDWCLITDDFLAGIRDILARPVYWEDQLRAGQKRIRAQYDPHVVVSRWKALLT